MAQAVRQVASSQGGSIGMSTVRRRLLVRRDKDIWPFVWRGLLPLLGLIALAIYALLPFARQTIEASVQQRVTEQLQQAGFNWAQVTVSGQQVLLSGSPPDLADGPRAIQSAFGAQCPTWAGLRTCAIAVVGAFAPAMPAVPAAPTPAPAVSSAPAVLAAPTVADECAKGLNDLMARSRIEFETGRADIRPSSQALLDRLASAAKSCPGPLRVEGHTDNVGAADMNQALSLARADAVKAALVQRGLEPSRVLTAGFGADKPLGDNATAEGRAQNRRIEFHPATTN